MNGIINVWKEKGFTSHDAVAKLRGICRQKKIGHTGTLDPDAQGVLPVCLGTATKACELLSDKDKEYEAVLLLGCETDTQDAGGTVLRQSDVSCTPEEVLCAIRGFLGTYEQVPPMYSALKVGGRKLCDLARSGITVERRARQVQIYEIEIQELALPRVTMRVHCSKGTYIRTLCHDIGKALGCGGCMESLVRTRAGMFGRQTAVTLSYIQQMADEGRLGEILLPVDMLLEKYPKAAVTSGFVKMLKNGNRLPVQALAAETGAEGQETAAEAVTTGHVQEAGSMEQDADSGIWRVYLDGDFFALYQLDAARQDYKPVKIFGQGN